MLAKLGEIKPSLSGSCKLMRKDTEEQAEGARPAESIKLMGMGLITTMTVYLLGTYVNKLIPAVHTYAWMILLVAVSKALGIVPKSMEHTVQQWSQFVMGNWTQALLVGIGISMIDLSAVISAFSFTYLILAEAIIMDYAKESLRLHSQWKGKIEVAAAVPVRDKDDMSLAYTPGVAVPCMEIQKDPSKSYDLTLRHNLCAVITDGSAVLGLGDIGPEADMPVMEGKRLSTRCICCLAPLAA